MAQSILIFDFGANEEAAQQARHKIDGWKQAFRLGDKLLLKFDRGETGSEAQEASDESGEGNPKSVGKASAKAKASTKKSSAKSNKKIETGEKVEPATRVRIFLRLTFSDHEKLSYQRWLDRIPVEEPFKSAKGEMIRSGGADFAKASEQFEALD